MCRKRLSSPRCRSELIDSAWVVIVLGQKCIQKTHKAWTITVSKIGLTFYYRLYSSMVDYVTKVNTNDCFEILFMVSIVYNMQLHAMYMPYLNIVALHAGRNKLLLFLKNLKTRNPLTVA